MKTTPIKTILLPLIALLAGCSGGGGSGEPGQTAYQVSGKISYAGAPAAGVSLAMTCGERSERVITAADGSYSLTATAGSCSIASADAYFGIPATLFFVSSGPVVVAEIAAHRLFSISGCVGLQGAPLAGTTVTLSPTSYEIYFIDGLTTTRNPANGSDSLTLAAAGSTRQTTDTSGCYLFTGLGAGSYTVTPSSAQYVFQLTATPTLPSSPLITISEAGLEYLYNPENGSNQQLDGIIYNGGPVTISAQAVTNVNFSATLPSGASN